MAKTTKNTKAAEKPTTKGKNTKGGKRGKSTRGKKKTAQKDTQTPIEKRTFDVFFNDTNIKTHPKGLQPRQAACKAVAPIIRYQLISKGITDKNEQKKNTEFINKKFIFYITEPKVYNKEIKKMIAVENPSRHYYVGERKGINPDINFYLSVGKEDNKTTIDIKDFKRRLTIEKNGETFYAYNPEDKTAKDTYVAKYPKSDITKDKDVKVVKVEVPRKNKIYETTVTTGPDGKEIKQKKEIGEDIKYIEYKFSNKVFKLTVEKYMKFKKEFKLNAKEEAELMKYIDKPKRQQNKKEEDTDEENDSNNETTDDEEEEVEEKPKKGRGKKTTETKPAAKGTKKGKK